MESCNTLTYNKTVLGEGERKEERKDPGKPGGGGGHGISGPDKLGFYYILFYNQFQIQDDNDNI